MADLGDLREGYWDKNELSADAIYIEKSLPHLNLMGVGTNLGCYGSIKPTVAKMNELKVGDVVSFDIYYPSMMYLTNSPYVTIHYKNLSE